MTLPNDDVINFVQNNFVLSHKNIEKEEHVGLSHGYSKTQSAVGTTNGAGGRNVQFMVLAADETVLHALPGFWHAQDLIPELQLGLEIDRLYRTPTKSDRQKAQMYELLHRTHMRRHGKGAELRGQWQSFDAWAENNRVQTEPRDTFYTRDDGKVALKSIPRVIHDRMLKRRFLKLEEFDLNVFADYGRAFYDNNHQDKGKTFGKARSTNRRRVQADEKRRKKEARDAAKLARSMARATRRGR